jgi:hypothetical protein
MTDTLRAWLDQAWNDHAEAPQRVGDELLARVAALPDDADGAEALRLGLHVLLGHRGDAAAVRTMVDGAPAGERLTPMRERAHWALATFEGRAAPALAEGPRWGALGDVVAAEIARGNVERARTLLLSEEPAAAASGDAAARKSFAASANNTASDLRTGPRGDAARDRLMIEAAEIARRAWERAGTWMNVERADYQLAMCHAALGQGAPALEAAHACLGRCEAEGAGPDERFFAHEALLHAHRAAGDAAAVEAERARMQALLAEIGDADLKAWCAETLANCP